SCLRFDNGAPAEAGGDRRWARSNRATTPHVLDGGAMPLYLDIHNKIEGLTAPGVSDAHAADLRVQHKYGVNYLRYWFDEGTGRGFGLVGGRSKEAAAAVQREAHGLVGDDIIEVKEGT